MALVVLTNQQKEALKNDTDFREEVKWAILNQAAYWKGLDGTAVPGGQTSPNLARWAKSRQLAAQITLNPAQIDPTQGNNQVVDRFLLYVKNITCYDDVVAFDTATVTAYLLANAHFEAMANNWFDDQISSYAF